MFGTATLPETTPIIFVIPAFDEEANLPRLFADLEAQILDRAGCDDRRDDHSGRRFDVDFRNDRPFDYLLDAPTELVAHVDCGDAHELPLD